MRVAYVRLLGTRTTQPRGACPQWQVCVPPSTRSLASFDNLALPRRTPSSSPTIRRSALRLDQARVLLLLGNFWFSSALNGPSWSFGSESFSSLIARLAQHLKCARAQEVALLGGLSAYSGFAPGSLSTPSSSFVDNLSSSSPHAQRLSRSRLGPLLQVPAFTTVFQLRLDCVSSILVAVVASSSTRGAVGAALCFERVPHPVRDSTRQAAGSSGSETN